MRKSLAPVLDDFGSSIAVRLLSMVRMWLSDLIDRTGEPAGRPRLRIYAGTTSSDVVLIPTAFAPT
jgi:hypothetical protein